MTEFSGPLGARYAQRLTTEPQARAPMPGPAGKSIPPISPRRVGTGSQQPPDRKPELIPMTTRLPWSVTWCGSAMRADPATSDFWKSGRLSSGRVTNDSFMGLRYRSSNARFGPYHSVALSIDAVSQRHGRTTKRVEDQ